MWRHLLLVVCVALGTASHQLTQAQEAGTVRIAEPIAGARLTGRVTITGSATHPDFRYYELAFAYDPDPTGTWFTLQPPTDSPMVSGVLGQWDTTGIVDGLYAIRLRVYVSERNFVETVVRGLRVDNTPVPTATLSPSTETPPTVTPIPLATPTAIRLPTLAPTRPPASPSPGPLTPGLEGLTPDGLDQLGRLLWTDAQRLRAAFWDGAQLSAAFFGILIIDSGLRRAWVGFRRRTRS